MGVPGEFDRKLYVANLPTDITEEELRKVFGLYGSVTEVHVMAQKVGYPDRSAFVRFEDAGEAAAAMAVLSEMYKFRDTYPVPVRVTYARADAREGTTVLPPPPGPPPPTAAPSGGGYSDGYGGQGGYGDQSGGYREQGGYGQGQGGGYGGGYGGQGAGGGYGGYSNGRPSDREHGGKLWVGNLPGDITREQVEKVFGVYGQVEEVNILPAKSRSGQLCAFVNFATATQADACLAAMATGYEMRAGEGELKVERPSDRRGKGGWGKGGGGGGRYGPY